MATFQNKRFAEWHLTDSEIMAAVENAIIALRRAEWTIHNPGLKPTNEEQAEIANPKETAAECGLARAALCAVWQELEGRSWD